MIITKESLDSINWNKGDGLIPAIIQDKTDKTVYMLGYMNKEALKKTFETGYVWFFSRTKNRLWMKGEESGNKLRVDTIQLDCDRDTLLVQINLEGTVVCHRGTKTCFD